MYFNTNLVGTLLAAKGGLWEAANVAGGDRDAYESALDAAIAAADDPDQAQALSEDLVRPLLDAAEDNPDMLLGRPTAPRKKWPGQILQVSGRLRNNLTSHYDSNSAAAGFNLVYAPTHQFGASEG